MNFIKKMGLAAAAPLLLIFFAGPAEADISGYNAPYVFVNPNCQKVVTEQYRGCHWRRICRNRSGWGGSYYDQTHGYRCWRDWYGYRYCRWYGGYFGPRYNVHYCRWACVYH